LPFWPVRIELLGNVHEELNWLYDIFDQIFIT
jgi:hypothetical protein